MFEITVIIVRQLLRELQAVYSGNFGLQLDRNDNRTAKFASVKQPLDSTSQNIIMYSP